MFPFHLMGGAHIRAVVEESRPQIVDRVRETYLAHHRGETVNPNSYFLRFPEKPNARIIALPAFLRGEPGVAGIKWIASFPDNVARNVPRASAVLVLNDFATGYPFACLEAAQISAARTAASAALAAERIHGSRTAARVAVIGAGIIARNILEFLAALHWSIGHVVVHDTVAAYARRYADHAESLGYPATVAEPLADAVTAADIVLLATTATEPYLLDAGLFGAGQTVLNISLRDLGPDVVAAAHNVVDDVDHCLTAGTSPHLAEQQLGHRDFIDATLAQLLLDEVTLGRDKPRVFSPFGLGVLDLAVGLEIFTTGRDRGQVTAVPDFFGEVERW
ncbi:2,3-diaminopropionate biosynthesis protein SbnB [Solwaraspora sp. WMMD1047]|uniref:2,3-diaminopropionate biosynthesis protein SbnB n=1 Tax=Solwaraspora sp. WMMD1047 TaxID=3016102 RepID=UPI002417FFD3|nr:2,3-diaminopropionate biosynthesis protein SbnB [Solwaraspora sp. WMMD1047]MDG4830668.1 2,3-diaminopropionate biosynthesis protein SbnB [Solwaraspora sp. WMMD1047]